MPVATATPTAKPESPFKIEARNRVNNLRDGRLRLLGSIGALEGARAIFQERADAAHAEYRGGLAGAIARAIGNERVHAEEIVSRACSNNFISPPGAVLDMPAAADSALARLRLQLAQLDIQLSEAEAALAAIA